MEYTHYELKILWHLKRNGGSISLKDPRSRVTSLIRDMAETLDIRQKSMNYILRGLEKKCLIVRTYQRGGSEGFNSRHGYDPLLKLELIDPDMYLPPLPGPMPLAAVVDKENEELYERTNCEPSNDDIIRALVTENQKLHAQIDKLQEIVHTLSNENERLKHYQAPKPRDSGLNQEVREALPPEVWDQLHHKGRR